MPRRSQAVWKGPCDETMRATIQHWVVLRKKLRPLCHALRPARLSRVGPAHQLVDLLDGDRLRQDAALGVEIGLRPPPGLPEAIDESLRIAGRLIRAAGRSAGVDIAQVRAQALEQPLVLVGDVVPAAEGRHRLAQLESLQQLEIQLVDQAVRPAAQASRNPVGLLVVEGSLHALPGCHVCHRGLIKSGVEDAIVRTL